VIVIAHRLSTIAHLDRVLVFARGQIVEDGTHAELLARRGEYHRLWRRQSGGILSEARRSAADDMPPDSEPDALADAARARIADGASAPSPEPA
jgi:ATP-binding cassette, subfamily B, bacterial